MKHLVLLFVLLAGSLFGQDLKFVSATMQTINGGAAPVSTTHYKVILEKEKQCKWSIDSIISISSGQSVVYTVVKIDNPKAASPRYIAVKTYEKADTGNYQINFSVTKLHGGGRPNGPQNMKVDTTTIDGGVVIYYHIKKKKKQMKVIEFEKLETIDAP